MHNLSHSKPDRIILIGASTGGPGHIRKIVQALPKVTSSVIIIAQHMEDQYISSFASQLQKLTQLEIKAVRDNMKLSSGKIYICSFTTQIENSYQYLRFTQTQSSNCRYNPDIDQLFISASLLKIKSRVLGIILTGIGDDGAQGCKLLSASGAKCIAESQSTAVVYGMPLQAKRHTKNILVQSLSEIILSINTFVS